jgi:hypothetical protein
VANPNKRIRVNQTKRIRVNEVSTVVRVLLLIWEVIRTLIDEHIFPGAGPGPLR